MKSPTAMEEVKAPIRVLMIGDRTLFCESLAHALNREPDIVVEHAAGIGDAIRALSHGAFDLVLLDYDLGTERASAFLSAARNLGYTGFVLVVSTWLSQLATRLLMKQGVTGIFPKDQGLNELLAAIRAVRAGGSGSASSFTQPSNGGSPAIRADKAQFAELESRVLRLIVEGLSNKEIGQQIQISESYVKAIIQKLFQKTGVRTRGQLVRLAIEQHRDAL